MRKFILRMLTEQDLPAYKRLRDQALRDFPEAFTSDYATEHLRDAESFANRITAPHQRGNKLWGAFDETGQLLGSIALEVAVKPQQRHIGTVLGMFVSTEAQRQGIASKLIACYIDFAKASGQYDQLILTVTASNAHVVQLYERSGFERYGLLPRAICVKGVFYDKLLMRLDLSNSFIASDKLAV